MSSTTATVRAGAHARTNNHVIAAASLAWVVLATVALGALAFAAHTTPYFGIDLVAAHAVQSIHAHGLTC